MRIHPSAWAVPISSAECQKIATCAAASLPVFQGGENEPLIAEAALQRAAQTASRGTVGGGFADFGAIRCSSTVRIAPPSIFT